MRVVAILSCILFPALLTSAAAADLSVRVAGIHDDAGRVRAALCTRAEYPDGPCAQRRSVAARVGAVELRFEGVASGRYAVLAYHDRDGDGDLDRGLLGIPLEPFGFGGATVPGRPPPFARIAVDVGEASDTVVVHLLGGAS
jgi:uncharacterized protein (DUF2141 family)